MVRLFVTSLIIIDVIRRWSICRAKKLNGVMKKRLQRWRKWIHHIIHALAFMHIQKLMALICVISHWSRYDYKLGLVSNINKQDWLPCFVPNRHSSLSWLSSLQVNGISFPILSVFKVMSMYGQLNMLATSTLILFWNVIFFHPVQKSVRRWWAVQVE